MLVLKYAFENDEFLAAIVSVGRKPASELVAHDRGCAGNLVTDPVKRVQAHAWYRCLGHGTKGDSRSRGDAVAARAAFNPASVREVRGTGYDGAPTTACIAS
jgi:hypothetical protein